jgi:hypothetical protein
MPQKQANVSMEGPFANMPTAKHPGRTYYATDTATLYTDTGTAWQVTTFGAGVSVAVTVPARQTVTGSPLVNSGTIAIADNTQAQNLVFAGPVSGAAAAPGFRALTLADLPAPVLAATTGKPSDTPTALTVRYDATAEKLWVYDGSAWKGVALTLTS